MRSKWTSQIRFTLSINNFRQRDAQTYSNEDNWKFKYSHLNFFQHTWNYIGWLFPNVECLLCLLNCLESIQGSFDRWYDEVHSLVTVVRTKYKNSSLRILYCNETCIVYIALKVTQKQYKLKNLANVVYDS